jgi:hypothetical protein
MRAASSSDTVAPSVGGYPVNDTVYPPAMDRRGFLSTATLSSVAAMGGGAAMPAWLAGCGGAPHGELGASETTALLHRLDRGLSRVAEEPMGALAAAQPWQVRPELSERVLRLGAQSLVVADVARSIPDGVRVPDELRGRLLETLPILDECTATYHRVLAGTPPAVRRNIDRHFRSHPEAAMDVAAYLDGHASAIGISPESRVRMRSNAAYVTTRIRRQSTTAQIDDCLFKVESTVARHGGSAAALRAARAPAFVDAIWQAVDGDPGVAASSPPPPPGYGGSAVVVAPAPDTEPYAPPPEPVASSSPGDTELIVGGVLIGAGLAVFGIGTLIGLAVGDVALAAAISATPGGSLVITGIICIIVGAVQNAG